MPLGWQADDRPGSDVDGLATALANQPLRNATDPRDIVLAGFRGKYLELSVPTDIDFDEAREGLALFPHCDEATFRAGRPTGGLVTAISSVRDRWIGSGSSTWMASASWWTPFICRRLCRRTAPSSSVSSTRFGSSTE